jgi:predicted TPR repeat methyltransferase
MISRFENLAFPSLEEVGQIVAALRQSSKDFETLFLRYANPAKALRHYGLVLWQAALVRDAVAAFQAAVTLDSENPDLWYDLAGAFNALDDAGSAESCVRMALHYNPRNAHAWFLLGNLKNSGGQIKDAEEAFQAAITIDPLLGDAHFALGLLYFSRQQLPEAVTALNNAIPFGYANMLGFAALGHVLYLTGDFAGCVAAFENAMRFGALDANARRKFARAQTCQTILDGSLEAAITNYPMLAGDDPEKIDDVLRDAFAQLSAYGHLTAAIDLGRFRLEQDKSDLTQRYLLDAVSGASLTQAPIDYVEAHFDLFAKTFDHKLVEILHYKIPGEMMDLVGRFRTSFENMLDLGCGTGLAVAYLARFGHQITGVDISGGMLEEAAKRGLYKELVKAEAGLYLQSHNAQFDLIIAADMLIYQGDLAPLFEAVAASLLPGGIFAMSLEVGSEADFQLLPSGRFSHRPAYIKRLSEPTFRVLFEADTTIRLEAGQPLAGILLVLERLS